MNRKLIVLCGPTASGKTKLGVALAKELDGEVVSADSMQIYRGMDIGTAKPSLLEREGIPHHMLDVVDPNESYSVARYVSQATACVEDILSRGKQPILVGGTGLYIDALVAGREFAQESSGVYRTLLQERLLKEGIPPLLDELKKVDPESADRLHPNDEKRILRALEVYYETGETISQHNARTKALPDRYPALRIGLSFQDRAKLYQRINQRVDEMLTAGLEAEVKALLQTGVSPEATAMQAIGYKEMVACLERGEPIQMAAEEIKLRSRQYAKRQLSWFRRREDLRWILWSDEPCFAAGIKEATAYIKEQLGSCSQENPLK